MGNDPAGIGKDGRVIKNDIDGGQVEQAQQKRGSQEG
jgi:hypothetical protein